MTDEQIGNIMQKGNTKEDSGDNLNVSGLHVLQGVEGVKCPGGEYYITHST